MALIPIPKLTVPMPYVKKVTAVSIMPAKPLPVAATQVTPALPGASARATWRAPESLSVQHPDLSRGPLLVTQTPLPFQFPSLDHFDDAITDAIARRSRIAGESAKTSAWRRDGYRSLRAYLVASANADAFLAGNFAVQVQLIEGWIGWLRDRECSHTTVNGYCRSLGGTLAAIATSTGMVSPMLGFPIPRAGESHRPRLAVRRVEELLDRTRNLSYRTGLERSRDVVIVSFFAFLGLRLGELLALKTSDVNVEAATVTISHGKGRNGGSSRQVTIPAFLLPDVADYVSQRCAKQRDESAFFVSAQTGRAVGTSTVKRLLKRVGSLLGMHLSPHMLRRTCEDWMRTKNVPPVVAMSQLGHRSQAMLLRYSQVTPDERATVIGSIDAV